MRLKQDVFVFACKRALRAFARWLSYVDERRRIMKNARTVILRARRQVSTAFQGWLNAVRTDKRQRIIVAHSIKRLKFRFLVKVFYTWIEFVHEALNYFALMRSVLITLSECR